MEVYTARSDHEGLHPTVDYPGLHPVPAQGQPQYLPQEGQPKPQYPAYGNSNQMSKICGLRWTTFWLTLLLILFLVAAIVAGTVGGVIASQRASSTSITTTTIASSTPTPTPSTSSSVSVLQSASTTSTPAITVSHSGTVNQPSPSSTVLRDGCPGSTAQKWVSSSGYSTFNIYCGIDFPVSDMINGLGVSADNFDACLEFCATMNDVRNFTLCYGVSYAYKSMPSGLCFLKNPAIDVASAQKSNVGTDSGILVF